MKHSRLLALLLVGGVCLGLMLTVPRALFAQGGQTTSPIKGVITDTTGAVIPGAKVTATHVSTNVSREAITSADGGYTIPNLLIGKYRLSVEKEGFRTEVRDNVTVVVGSSTVIDVQMSVGAVTQTVTVSATVVPITEDKADRGIALTANAITDLPVQVSGSWRQVDTFLILAPGVTGDTFSARINGGPDVSQDFYYDGAPYMNADGAGRQEGVGPAFEAVDEYAIQTNPYSAQFGRGTGLMNFHIRSGTNELHGSVWEFNRYNCGKTQNPNLPPDQQGSCLNMDARGFFSNRVGTTKQNEYGFRVGGPVYIPKAYDGRNKTFFFFLANWFKLRGGTSNNLITLPTPAMKAGDFRELGFNIYDPATTRPDGAGSFTRDVFLCNGVANTICANRKSALSSPWIDLIPTGTPGNPFNNARAVAPVGPQNYYTYLFKIDHNVGSKVSIHGSYYRNKFNSPSSPVISGPLGNGNQFNVDGWEPRISVDWTVASNIQNQFAASPQYTRGIRNFFPVASSIFSPLITTGIGQPLPAIVIQGMPTFGVGATNGGYSGGCWPCYFMADNLKWIKGRHSLAFGMEMRWEDEKNGFAINNGTYSFNRGTTSLPNSTNFGSLGYGFASFYIGTPTQISRTGAVQDRLLKTGYRAFYVQDDIRVSSKLTVNVGLRWDVGLPVQDPADLLSSFVPDVANPGASGRPGALVFAGSNGVGGCIPTGASLCRKRFADTYWNSWQPRLGFAYRLNDQTVLRSGFGISSVRGGASTIMGPEIAASFLTGLQYQDVRPSLDNGISPPPSLSPTWDATGIPPLGSAPARTLSAANGQNAEFMQKVDGHTGYMMQWSMTVERKLPGQVAFEASYVGSGSHRIGANMLNANQVNSRYLSLLRSELNQNISCLGTGACPNAVAAGVISPFAGFTGTVQQALRPFPQFLFLSANTQQTGNATYHSLQMRAQKYFSQGVTFLVSFTWYKNLINTGSQFSTFSATPLDVGNQKLEKANTYGNGAAGPRIFNIAESYELPMGPGKRFFNQGGVVGKFVGGWTIGSILRYNAGGYLTMGGGSSNPIFNNRTRPDRVLGQPVYAATGKFDPATQFYFNPSAFADAGQFRLGNAPPVLPDARGFAYYNENLSIIKRTSITESKFIEFRSDWFNALNRVVFCGPGTGFSFSDPSLPFRSRPGFGKVTCQGNSPRNLQFSLRFSW